MRLAVGAERHGGNPTLMPQEADELAGGGVPEPRSLSWHPVRMVLPSGLKATALTWLSCRMGSTDGLASRRVPELRRAVVDCR